VPALDVLKYPLRRDVKTLGTILGEIESPSPVRATFVEDRYGTFVVEGDAVLSTSVGTLTLAGRFIEQGMKPDRTLRLIAPVTADSRAAVSNVDGDPAEDAVVDASAPDDIVEPATDSAEPATDIVEPATDTAEPATDIVEPATDTDELRTRVTGLTHGDLVRAGFYVRAYGSFTITGFAVWSAVANVFIVGGWFISADGAPAPHLESLTVLATADEHGGAVPPQITAALDDVVI
jgi:hypothetical protein